MQWHRRRQPITVDDMMAGRERAADGASQITFSKCREGLLLGHRVDIMLTILLAEKKLSPNGFAESDNDS